MTTDERLERIESLLRDHITASRERNELMAAELARNTEVTGQVREAVKAAAWAKRFIVWVGGLAAGLAGFLQLYDMIKGRTPWH